MGHTAPVGGKQHCHKTCSDKYQVFELNIGDQCDTSKFAKEPSSILSADCIGIYTAKILPLFTV